MLRFAIFLLIAGSCFGQRLSGTFSGWGSVASPGTGYPPGTLRLGNNANRGAYRGGVGRNPGYRNRGAVAVPYLVGGFGGYGYSGYGYAGDPNGYVDNSGGIPPAPQYAQPPAPAAPPVIINQYFGMPPGAPSEAQDDPSVRIYSQPSAHSSDGQSSGDPQTYLIAYKDHSVYTALAYWVENHTLHYVTTSNTHNQADLDLIDLDFTKKLNQERSLPFTLNR